MVSITCDAPGLAALYGIEPSITLYGWKVWVFTAGLYFAKPAALAGLYTVPSWLNVKVRKIGAPAGLNTFLPAAGWNTPLIAPALGQVAWQSRLAVPCRKVEKVPLAYGSLKRSL